MSRPVEFLYDFASPYAYLAWARLAEFEPALAVQPVPVYLRGIFQTANPHFSDGLLVKGPYILKDVLRCADYWSIEVRIPDKFPINGLKSMRGAAFAETQGRLTEYNAVLWKATWTANVDIEDPSNLARLAEEAGLDPNDYANALGDPAIKERLKANTDRAVQRGAFGVPSFFDGEEMFFGADRLEMLAKSLNDKQ